MIVSIKIKRYNLYKMFGLLAILLGATIKLTDNKEDPSLLICSGMFIGIGLFLVLVVGRGPWVKTSTRHVTLKPLNKE